MKRKKFIAAMLMIIFSVVLCSCEVKQKKSDNSADPRSFDNNKKTSEIKQYDASPEWSDFCLEDMAIQVDDTVYAPGMTAKEVIEKVEKSNAKYDYTYNEKKQISASQMDTIDFFRNDQIWFTANVINVGDKLGPLSDTILVSIDINEYAEGYCRYFDGKTFEEIQNMSDEEAKKLFADVKTEDTYEGNVNEDLIARISPNKEESSYAKKLGRNIKIEQYIDLFESRNTSKISRIKMYVKRFVYYDNDNQVKCRYVDKNIPKLEDYSKMSLY